MTTTTLTGEQVEAKKAELAEIFSEYNPPDTDDFYNNLNMLERAADGWMELAGHFEQQATRWKTERDEVRDHNADIMLQLLELNGGNVELIAERDALAAKVRELQGEVKWKERDK